MLGTRVMTAIALLAALLAVAYFATPTWFALAVALFFAATVWEALRLFGAKWPALGAAAWTAVFLALYFQHGVFEPPLLFGLCALIWALRFAPSLAIELPPRAGPRNMLLGTLYCIALLGAFLALPRLYEISTVHMLSVLAIVWIADIGAYAAGKLFGKRKLAPTISPGKSWEGAIGGWLTVLGVAALSASRPFTSDSFDALLLRQWGWIGLLGTMTVLTAASVVGDLFESRLKRRAGVKDSSGLLPGHGGLLDRVDALIPVLPLAVLVDYLLIG
jgi:phosphatidate cytidylyltransferase